MLKLVTIKDKQITRYKQPENFIAGGQYYRFFGRPTQEQKKCFELIAAGGEGYPFMWLAPAEPWVKRLADGQLFPEPTINEEPDWNLLGTNPKLLRNWQRQLAREVWNHLRSGMRYGRGWIAKLGAGKTLAGLVVAQLFEPDEVLVLADRYLYSTWEQQAEEWGLNCPILSTYESCHKVKNNIKCLINDECNRHKNPDAQRTNRAAEIAANCEVVLSFTGIPTGGKGPMDFRWLRVPCPGSVPATENAWKFLFGLDTDLKEVGPNKAYITTEWDEEKVSDFIAPFIRTVDPAEINAELPEITERYIPCPLPKEFDLVKSGGATAKGTHKKLSQIRQITDGFVYDDNDKPIRVNNPKLKVVRQFVEDLGEPVILVSNWREGIELLKEEFADYTPSVIAGGTKDFKAQIEAFQAGLTGMMILNAGFSKGMNLQKVCRTVCFLSVSSKPDDYQQMVGRVYRPGQKNAVQVVHFCCEGSLDRHIIKLVQNHRDVSEDFIEQLLLEELAKL